MVQPSENLALDWTVCPLVEVNPHKLGGVPILRGSCVQAAYRGTTQAAYLVDEIADIFDLPANAVRELLAYAVKHNPALRP